MKLIRLIIPILLLFLLLLPVLSKSQTIGTSDYNSFSMDVKGGIMRFYGDVRQQKYASDNKYKKANICVALDATKNFNNKFGLRLGALTGGLSGSSPNLNLHFESKLYQYSLQGIISLNNLLTLYPKKEKKFNAYLFGGVGMINFRSKIYSYDEDTFITAFGWDSTGLTKSKARNEIIFPFGIGIKFKADEQFDFGIEFAMQVTNTDKLDAWMVNGSYMDRYSCTTACIIYKIGSKKEYIDWVNPFMDTTKMTVATAQYNQKTENVPPVKANVTDTPVKTNTKKNDETTKEPEKKVKVDIKQNSEKTKLTENKVKTNAIVVQETTDKFYVTSGSFSAKKVANEKAGKLKKKGYTQATTMETNNGNWLASYASYSTREDAWASLETLKMYDADAKLFEKNGEKDFSEITEEKALNTDTAKSSVRVTSTIIPEQHKEQSTNVTTNTPKPASDSTKAKETVKTVATTIANSNIMPVNTTTNNQVTTQTQLTTATTTTIIKKFFIIAGSYPTEQMANDEVTILKAKGFPDAEVVGKNDAGNWRICYKAYATREDANKDMPAIKAKSLSAWIFEKK